MLLWVFLFFFSKKEQYRRWLSWLVACSFLWLGSDQPHPGLYFLTDRKHKELDYFVLHYIWIWYQSTKIWVSVERWNLKSNHPPFYIFRGDTLPLIVNVRGWKNMQGLLLRIHKLTALCNNKWRLLQPWSWKSVCMHFDLFFQINF